MEEPANDLCRNCHHPLPPLSKYCPACGQKNTDGRLSFPELLQEFVANLFNLDNRIFRTLGTLAVPGKLTQEYFKGRHVPFYHPVRLFLISAGLFTAMLTITLGRSGLKDFKMGLDAEKDIFQENAQYRRLDTISLQVKEQFTSPEVAEALDTLKTKFVRKPKTKTTINTTTEPGRDTTIEIESNLLSLANKDSISLNKSFRFGQDEIKVAVKDIMELTEDELVVKYGVEGFGERLFFRQYVRITKGGTKFIFYLIGNTIWMMLVMMPMLALVLKLLYIRRGYFYYEHLLFSFHTHTFVFLLYALLMALGSYVPDDLASLSFPALGIYLYLAMKRFYGQGWLKTLLKFAVANFMYLIIFLIAAMLISLASVALF